MHQELLATFSKYASLLVPPDARPGEQSQYIREVAF